MVRNFTNVHFYYDYYFYYYLMTYNLIHVLAVDDSFHGEVSLIQHDVLLLIKYI